MDPILQELEFPAPNMENSKTEYIIILLQIFEDQGLGTADS